MNVRSASVLAVYDKPLESVKLVTSATDAFRNINSLTGTALHGSAQKMVTAFAATRAEGAVACCQLSSTHGSLQV